MIRAARWYARRGFHVFPCAARAKTPATAHGCNDATTDLAIVERWWRRAPSYNIGIACGPSGLLVLDIDGGKSGWDSLDRLQGQHGELPVTPTAETASGVHFYYGGEGRSTASTIAQGIDTRGRGGYVLAPPSVHPSGHVYRWERGRGIHEVPIAPAPAWLLEALRPREPERSAVPIDLSHVRLGAYARAALASECAAVRRAPKGARNDKLNAAAFAIGQLVGAGAIEPATARRALIEVGRRVGLSLRETIATVGSGLSAGIAQPRRMERRCG